MSAFRYWRLASFAAYPSTTQLGGLFEHLSLITSEGVLSNNPLQASFSGVPVVGREASRAFDWDTTPPTNAKYISRVDDTGEAWLAYDFEEPVTVTSVSVRFHGSALPSNTAGIWDFAKVQASVDGVVWGTVGEVALPSRLYTWRSGRWEGSLIYKGSVEAHQASASVLFAHEEYSIWEGSTPTTTSRPEHATDTVVRLGYDDWLDPLGLVAKTYAGQVGRGVAGYIAGKVYERVGATAIKKPVRKIVHLILQKNMQLIVSQWSDETGYFIFRHLNPEEEFIILAIDQTKKWGLEGSAYRRPRERTYDGTTIQYPTK